MILMKCLIITELIFKYRQTFKGENKKDKEIQTTS